MAGFRTETKWCVVSAREPEISSWWGGLLTYATQPYSYTGHEGAAWEDGGFSGILDYDVTRL